MENEIRRYSYIYVRLEQKSARLLIPPNREIIWKARRKFMNNIDNLKKSPPKVFARLCKMVFHEGINFISFPSGLSVEHIHEFGKVFKNEYKKIFSNRNLLGEQSRILDDFYGSENSTAKLRALLSSTNIVIRSININRMMNRQIIRDDFFETLIEFGEIDCASEWLMQKNDQQQLYLIRKYPNKFTTDFIIGNIVDDCGANQDHLKTLVELAKLQSRLN
jgi:hypothetical protein